MMNKVMTANGITGARADLIDDAHQICGRSGPVKQRRADLLGDVWDSASGFA